MNSNWPGDFAWVFLAPPTEPHTEAWHSSWIRVNWDESQSWTGKVTRAGWQAPSGQVYLVPLCVSAASARAPLKPPLNNLVTTNWGVIWSVSQLRMQKAALSSTRTVLQPDSQKGNSIFSLPCRLAALKTLLEKGTAQLPIPKQGMQTHRHTQTHTPPPPPPELSFCFPEHKTEVERS